MDLKFSSLSRKLVWRILLASTAVTTVMTIVSFYSDYQEEVNQLSQTFRQIEEASLPPLGEALWNMSQVQITTQLKALTSIGDIVGARLVDGDNKTVLTIEPHGEHKVLFGDPFQEKRFRVTYQDGATVETVGTLTVIASRKNMINRLTKKVLTFFALQALKTFLVSSLIFWIVTNLLVRHLRHIASSYLESQSNESITLDRPASVRTYDELDQLVATLNHLRQENFRYQEDLKGRLVSTEDELQKQRAQAIEQAKFAALGEMAAGLAHEINNPVAVIVGKADRIKFLLGKDPVDAEKLLASVEIIEKTGLRISKIVQGLRTFARDGAQDTPMPVNLRDLAEDSLILASEKSKRINAEIRLNLPSISIDTRATPVSQIILNLISNGLDAIQDLPEKWLELSATHDDQFIHLRVTDSGSGIPPEIRNRLMQPFFTTKEVGKGTGLGLSISKNLAEQNGGHLWVDDKSPNTCFVLSLPKVGFHTKAAA